MSKIFFFKCLYEMTLSVLFRHKAHTMAELLVNDAHKTFVACFHAFYPTGPLKWVSLCNLLNQQEVQSNYHILAATIDALCNPVIKLRSIFPIGVTEPEKSTTEKSPSENISTSSVTGSVLFLGKGWPFLSHRPSLGRSI